MIKIFMKEDWSPPFADRPLFVIAPALLVVTTLMSFAIVPFGPGAVVADLNVGVLFFLAVSSLGVYGIALGGWSSNNKYALLGAVRATAQMLTYEVFMGLALMGVVMLAGSFNLSTIVTAQERMWFCIPQFAGLVIFMIAGLAEAHRLPFDLPEAESELVSGYHTEYSGIKFGLFFVGEYLGITLLSMITVTLYFGGWMGPLLPPVFWFAFKTFLLICVFILMRAALPRPRFDQLMHFAWLGMMPLSLLNLLVTAAIVISIA